MNHTKKDYPDEILLINYKKSYDSFDREYIVDIMKKRKLLTPLIIEECQYDFDYLIIYDPNIKTLIPFHVAVCFSGGTAPSGYPINCWYDTTNNKIKYTFDGTYSDTRIACLPLGIYHQVSAGYTYSINQIFNGFGYIGSTAFALPGVKGLIPNGRNADGTLKNTSFTIGKVLTFTTPNNIRSALGFLIYKDDNYI